MRKRGKIFIFVILFLILLLTPFILADSAAEIQKITHYAEQYETGNIDYVQLLVYLSSVRESLNEILGATERYEGGVLKQEQIEKVLGEPNRETKWVWVERENHETKLDNPVPVWENNIVFDGKKIRITLNAHPSLFKKKQGPVLVYRLHPQIEFKRPNEELDIQTKINDIQSLAEIFNSDSSRSNAEALAKESVNTERAFESFFKQNQGKCEDLMKSIFGSENQRETMYTIDYEIIFYEGNNFEVIARLQMCDECEWNWVNIHFWIEGRGPGFKPPKDIRGEDNIQRFKNMGLDSFKAEAEELLDEMKRLFEQGDHAQAMSYAQKLSLLNEAWNEKANDVWEQVDEEFYGQRGTMADKEWKQVIQSKEESHGDDPYHWIKEEQAKRARQRELRKANYEERKQFYLNYFAAHDKKEYYFTQIEFEKRLVEEFKEFGEEICDNNQDDNQNEQVDCDDAQCGGKFCGKTEVEITKDNKTVTEVRDLFCIGGTCQLKDEETPGPKEPVCGNHICEEGEADIIGECPEEIAPVCMPIFTPGTCPKDCIECPEHPPVNCSGKVIFSGEDENGCPLEPVCIPEIETCETDEDCTQPLCGYVECLRFEPEDELGKCELTKIKKCVNPDCVDGDKKIKTCGLGGEVTTHICVEGLWEETGVKCKGEEEVVCCKETGAADSIDYIWLDKDKCVGGDNKARDIVNDKYCGEEEMTCEEYCMNQPRPLCGGEELEPNQPRPLCGGGELEVSGTYPDCSCKWVYKKPVVGDECTVREDCGGKHDVCSNGKCVPIPEIIPIEPPEPPEPIVKPAPPEQPIEPIEPVEPEEPTEEPVEESPQEPESEVEEEEPEEEAPEPEPEEQEAPTTGEFIFGFFRALVGRITGFATGEEGGDVGGDEGPPPEDTGEDTKDPDQDGGGDDADGEPPSNGNDGSDDGGDGSCPDAGEPPKVEENCWYKETYDERGCVSGYDVECGEWKEDDEDWEKHEEDWKDKDWEKEEGERQTQECKERCSRECYDMEVRPCVEDCIWEECGEQLDCDADEVTKSCEDSCIGNLGDCENDCQDKCMRGEETWEEPERKEHKEEKGVFAAGGGCRTSQGSRTEAFIWFNGWGEPFEEIQPLKYKYYSGGEADWCKWDLQNLKKQRKEFEKGFNQQFVEWFFEKYLANSAEDWEQHVSGIFELYWRDVDMSMEMAHRMRCLEINEVPEHNLINVEYESDYGKLKFWEELKTAVVPGMDEEMTLISPYMEVWIFPPKEFFIYELKQSMENHEFPGPPEEKIERKNREGELTEEEKERLRQDKGFMKKMRNIYEKYNGNADVVIQFKNQETNEVVFNLYVQLNEEDIIKVEPMLPEEVPKQDIKIEMDVEKLYDIIEYEERNMRGAEIESPPWDRQKFKPTKVITDIKNGVQMYFKFRSLMDSAKVTPESAEDDAKSILKPLFMSIMGGGGPEEDRKEFEEEGEERTEKDKEKKEPWEAKEIITGEVIG